MIKHYFKSIILNIKNNTLNYFLNIIGLVIALLSSLVLFIYVIDEYKFDDHHINVDRIYRINMKVADGNDIQDFATSDGLLINVLKSEVPEVQEACRMQLLFKTIIKIENSTFKETGFYFSSEEVFNIFDYSFIHGQSQYALSEPNSIVITESLAKKYYGSVDVLNKEVIVNDTKYNITGVIKDLPKNSSLYFRALISNKINKDEGWLEDTEYYNFVLLKENSSPEDFDNKLNNIAEKYVDPIIKQYGLETKIRFYSESLKDIHFSSIKLGDFQKGNKKMVHFFLIFSLFILLTACFNYINIFLSLIYKKSNIIRIKKIHGMRKTQLFFQYIIEPTLIVFLSVILSIVVIFIFREQFNLLLAKSIFTSFYKEWSIWIVIIGFFLLSIIIIGLYPSIFASSIKVNYATKKVNEKRKNLLFSKVVLMFQIALSFLVVTFTIVNHNQLKYMRNYNLGLKAENVLVVKIPDNYNDINGIVKKIRNELLKEPSIKEVSISGFGSELFSDDIAYNLITSVNMDGENTQLKVNVIEIDEEYLDLMEIKLIDGKGFNNMGLKSNKNSVIINKTLLKKLKIKDPIGMPIMDESDEKIIGVVEDFHYKSLHNIIEPVMFYYISNDYSNLFIRLSSKSDINIVKKIWKNHLDDYPMFYFFEEDNYARAYSKDEKVYSMLLLSIIILIVISCLGMYNLSSISIKHKTKSISIRYVLGARKVNVIMMLLKEYILLVVISTIIGWPLAFLLIKRWLETFHYRIDIAAWPFILAFVIVLFISLLTISYHVIKISNIAPVDTLKDN